MQTFTTLQVETLNGIAHVTLNRPTCRNAFDGQMTAELSVAFSELGQHPAVRCIILRGSGPAFCAGADLRWVNPGTPVSETQAYDDAVLLTRMYQAIDECPCPVIGCIHGSAFGGGVGLVAVCDIAVATEDTTFALSEVKLGLMPAVITPFLLRKTGESFLRRYCLTGESFSASVAKQFHLVHEIVASDGLEHRLGELSTAILRLAPQAVRNTKTLLRNILPLHDTDRRTICAQANARTRISSEAQEGLRAFLEKRSPAWVTGQGMQRVEHDGVPSTEIAKQRT